MNISMLSFKVASWTLVLGGFVHTISDLLSPESPERTEIIMQMQAFTGQVMGTEFNLFSFHQGFSYMMGLLLVGYGGLNLLVLKNNSPDQLAANIIIFNIIISFVSVILSIKYFFMIPALLTGIPCLGFFISYITSKRL